MRVLLLALAGIVLVSSANVPWKPNENNNGKTWVLLAAGSKGWNNYRHQAGVFHAYQVLRARGVSSENIIVIAADDIANDPENPYPGKVFNSPDKKDVRAGVEVDYSGSDATEVNFLAALTGDKDSVTGGSGRVIESTENDNIFVFFSDHGAAGFFDMGGELVTRKKLFAKFKEMKDAKKYKQLTFYLESCLSGSVFDGIPAELDVYAVTGANQTQNHYAMYCYTDVLPKNCLAGEFSHSWISNSAGVSNDETLDEQFQRARKEVTHSRVCQWGDLDIDDEQISVFQGGKPATDGCSTHSDDDEKYETISQVNVPLRNLREEYKTNPSPETEAKINELYRARDYVLETLAKVVNEIVPEHRLQDTIHAGPPERIIHEDCHDEVITAYHQLCFRNEWDPYGRFYSFIVVNLCEAHVRPAVIIDALKKHCSNDH